MSKAGAVAVARERLQSFDWALVVLLVMTTVSLTLSVSDIPFGLGDLLLVPIVVFSFNRISKVSLPFSYGIAVFAYLFWCLLSEYWVTNFRNSLPSVIQYMQFMLVTVAVFSTVSSLRAVTYCIRAYVLAASALSASVIVYAFATGTFYYVYFLNYQKNYLGSIVGNALPLIVGLTVLPWRRKWMVWAAMLLNLSALLLSTSRGAMVGAIIGSIIVLALCGQLRRSVALFVGGFGVFSAYSNYLAPNYADSVTDFSSGSSAYSRVTIFNDAMDKIDERWMAGSGIGSYHIAIPSIGFSQDDPNNVFLLNMAEVGFVGTVLFSIMILAIVGQWFRNRRHFRGVAPAYGVVSASLAGGFASHFAHIQSDVSWVRGTGTFMFACVGLLFALPRLWRQESASAPSRAVTPRSTPTVKP